MCGSETWHTDRVRKPHVQVQRLTIVLGKLIINDGLKASRRDAIAYVKSFWGLGHQRLNFDGFIYIRYVAPPYSAGTVITASVY